MTLCAAVGVQSESAMLQQGFDAEDNDVGDVSVDGLQGWDDGLLAGTRCVCMIGVRCGGDAE